MTHPHPVGSRRTNASLVQITSAEMHLVKPIVLIRVLIPKRCLYQSLELVGFEIRTVSASRSRTHMIVAVPARAVVNVTFVCDC